MMLLSFHTVRLSVQRDDGKCVSLELDQKSFLASPSYNDES